MVRPGDVAVMEEERQARYEEVATRLRLEGESGGDGEEEEQRREDGEREDESGAQLEYWGFVEEIQREVEKNWEEVVRWTGQGRMGDYSNFEKRLFDGFRGVGMMYGGPVGWDVHANGVDGVDGDGLIDLDAAG
ncbi:MAG: hypothetical protein Q9157_000972 [Trypethelium eluteriae]